MSLVSSSIILRRLDYSEYDYILDILTRDFGKLTVIAKNAKKSKKRFAGVLELFACMEAVFAVSKSGRGMPLLKESLLTHPFAGIRCDAEKVAYASYWSEMINRWVVQGGVQSNLFPLFFHALTLLDADQASNEAISLLFQIRFMTLAGMSPELSCCRVCRKPLDDIAGTRILFDAPTGGLICDACARTTRVSGPAAISKSAVKQLLWLKEGNPRKAERIQLTEAAKREGLEAMEMFVPFHLATEIRSLKILRCIREWRQNNNARKHHTLS
ncbi:MAG: DNA repair protein RecO [Thermodesulfobacteriota bacterium]